MSTVAMDIIFEGKDASALRDALLPALKEDIAKLLRLYDMDASAELTSWNSARDPVLVKR